MPAGEEPPPREPARSVIKAALKRAFFDLRLGENLIAVATRSSG